MLARGGPDQTKDGGFMNELVIKEKEIEQKNVEILEMAKATRIVNNEQYVKAGEILLAIKQARKSVDETFDPVIAAAFRSHKEACNAKKKIESPIVEAEGIIKAEIGRYMEEQERIRREEELKLQELARKHHEDMALQEAAALEDAGLRQEAEDAISNPVMPAIVLSNPVPKVTGISSRESYYATVTDIKALCRAVADGRVPPMSVIANMTFLNNQARAMKGLMQYPGVTVQSKKVISGKL